MFVILGPGSYPDPPFRPLFQVAVAGDRIFLGPGDAFEIQAFSGAGLSPAIFRSDHVDRIVTDAAREAYLAEARQEVSERPAEAVDRFLALMPFPDSLPAHGDLIVDSEDLLWVQDYPIPGTPVSWSIFGPEGERIATVTVPSRLDIHDIGEDYLLGVWTDEFDIPYVRLYALSRAPEEA
jgi:hypothetical protein